ncbi:hypothetical protein O3597_20190 [Verrucosispora sp. WMMA2044]|uniref:hypothetical protein n=1 Tax=Verrucosispora sp. WMMA2044 TaxID=3016419 RepID=UPI00248BDCFC|nr:hypothetical protein [Verrucosispora sp. WMMA2044]WBB47448.1 hypothetical protein O3597_20190 [Verrucosispora sp. WMMA2044]
MELRRHRTLLVLGLFLFVTGALVLGCIEGLTVFGWIFGFMTLLTGGGMVLAHRQPFKFHIGPNGLVVQVTGFSRAVPWAEVDAIILDPQVPTVGEKHPISTFLLLVPAAGSTIGGPFDGRSPLDGRPALVLFDLVDVRQPVKEVAAVLARFAGSRFTDVRQLHRARFDSPQFTMRPEGYEPARVNQLIQIGQDVLLLEQSVVRSEAKTMFDRARAELPTSELGYDRAEVDSMLDELSSLIARRPDEAVPPNQHDPCNPRDQSTPPG